MIIIKVKDKFRDCDDWYEETEVSPRAKKIQARGWFSTNTCNMYDIYTKKSMHGHSLDYKIATKEEVCKYKKELNSIPRLRFDLSSILTLLNTKSKENLCLEGRRMYEYLESMIPYKFGEEFIGLIDNQFKLAKYTKTTRYFVCVPPSLLENRGALCERNTV